MPMQGNGRFSDDGQDYSRHWTVETPKDRKDFSDTEGFNYFKDLLPKPPFTVIDIGCGGGFWYTPWKLLGADYIGIDANRDGINLAMERHPNVIFICRRAEEFTFIPEYFDVAFCHAVLQHTNIATKKKLLPNVFQGLKNGGLFILEEKHDEGDGRVEAEVTYYTVQGWVDLLSGFGFEFVLESKNGMVFRKPIVVK